MYREEFPPLRWLTSWLPRLLVAGSFALGGCDAGDTTAPTADDPAVSPAQGPNGHACIGCPVVSSHILFAAWAGSTKHNEIYSMNPDGTGRKLIVTSDMDDYDPAWSPNYTRLVFSRRHGGYLGTTGNGLWTVGSDGLGLFRVTSDSSDKGPSWGKTNRVAFYSARETHVSNTNEVFTINPDGTGLTRLTNNAAEDRNPAWSPDGSRIVFASDRGPGRLRGSMHLWKMNADGTGLTQLTFGAGEDQPAWSPDGTRIAYSTIAGGNSTGVWVMNVDGTNATQLVSGFIPAPGGWLEYHPGQPSWSPDSKQLAFSSDLSGQYQIYTVGAAGGGGLKLSTVGQEQMPAWSY
jgi:Tol biopolymer transport system component